MIEGERRGSGHPFRLTKGLAVEVLIDLGSDGDLVVPAEVIAMSDRTVSIEVADGPLGLAVNMSPRCTVVVAGDTPLRAVPARPGRRTDDVQSPTVLELVLEETPARARR